MPHAIVPTPPFPSAAKSSAPLPSIAEPLRLEQAQLLLRVLGEPIRLDVVKALGGGERCVCELTAELALTQSKLSFHLKVMKEAGLISSRQEGRWIYYCLVPSTLLSLRDWLEQLTAGCGVAAHGCT